MSDIKGTMTIGGVLTAGVTVRAHRSDTGAVLGSGVSQPAGTQYNQVASEGGTFTVAAGDTIRYGAAGGHADKTYSTPGSYTCNSAEFGGDPASGQAKTCSLAVPVNTGDYTIPNLSYSGDVYLVAINPDTAQNDAVLRLIL